MDGAAKRFTGVFLHFIPKFSNTIQSADPPDTTLHLDSEFHVTNHRIAKLPLTRSIFLLGLAALVGGTAQAQDQGVGTTMELKAGVIVDTVKNRVFYMNREGGIEAVDVASGRTLWSSKEIHRVHYPLRSSTPRTDASSCSVRPPCPMQ